jgi:hypothetical protein
MRHSGTKALWCWDIMDGKTIFNLLARTFAINL